MIERSITPNSVCQTLFLKFSHGPRLILELTQLKRPSSRVGSTCALPRNTHFGLSATAVFAPERTTGPKPERRSLGCQGV